MEKPKIQPVTHEDVKSMVDARKWFYTPTVREHFFNPKNIFKTEEEVATYKADGIGMVGSPACTEGKTLIHVNFDVQQMDNLTKGHKVLSHDGSYNKITKFYHPKYDGKIVKVKNQFGDVVLTPDHLVYAMQIPEKGSWAHNKYKRKLPVSWVHAGNLQKGDICPYPIPKEVKEVEYIEIPVTKKNFDYKSKTIPTKIKVTKDLLRLFGYFVAEGHTRKGEIGFTFGITEEKFVEDVIKLLKKIFKLDTYVKKREDRNRIDVTTNSIHLARYLRKNCGTLSYNKKIPEFIIFLEPELQKSFLYGVWHSDGYIDLEKKKPRAEYATASWILAQELKVLLLRQKIEHSIYFEEAKVVKGVNHAECYRIHVGDYEALKKMSKLLKVKFSYPKVSRIAKHSWFDKNYFYMPIRKVEKSQFSGRLHNLEVAKTHSYVSDAFTLHNCGDAMKMWIKVDKEQDRITECKWQTFGCASAIGSTSMLSVMISENGGMKINDALVLKPQDIMERLGGLPAKKFHCSVLGDKALRSAINDFFRKSEQTDRIIVESARIVDPTTKVTDKDIEEAVLEGADTLEKVQKKLKVGIGSPEVIPAVEELIRFYREKYFG
tara:strand:+ start:28211 stop:30019 length:1809 start_codon:yes stop_codon:yes gene_type:complete